MQLIVTLIIGTIAGLLTLRQYQLAKAKLKLDLFQKRFDIFHKIWIVLSETAIVGTRPEHHGLGTPFNNYAPEAFFIFGKDIEAYMEELSTRWKELRGLEERDDITSPERNEHIERMRVLTDYFFEQVSHGAKARFAPYLSFEKWK